MAVNAIASLLLETWRNGTVGNNDTPISWPS